MKYCTVPMIQAHQRNVVLKTEGEGINCRVLLGGKEDIICEYMPDNLKFDFKKFCDGCTDFKEDISYALGNDDVFITCKHMQACKNLKERLVDAYK